MNYEHKYYKYKNKYLKSKLMTGGDGNTGSVVNDINSGIIAPLKTTLLQPPQQNKSSTLSENKSSQLRGCPIKWMIHKETELSKRLVEFQSQFDCSKNVDGLHMTMAFCNINPNIYALVKELIEVELDKLLRTGEFGQPLHIREKAYKPIGGFLIAMEYFTSPAILDIVSKFRKLVIDIVINKCKELYTVDLLDDELENYIFQFDRKKGEIIKIKVHDDKIKDLPPLNYDAKTVMFYVNGKWKEIIQLRIDDFLPHISIVDDGKMKSGKECKNSDKLQSISIKPDCNREFVYDEKDFAGTLLLR